MITTYQNDGATPYLHLSNPFPQWIDPAGRKLSRLVERLWIRRQRTAAQRHHTPYEQSWSFGLEMQLPAQILTNMMYVGKKGTHLYYSGDNYINHLGPAVEGYNATQLNNLTTMVNNPVLRNQYRPQ
jgi:hypothetical protein